MKTPPNNVRLPAARRWLWPVGLLAITALICAAFVYAGSAPPNANRVTPNDVPTEVGIEQKLSAQVPLDLQLRDESGNAVRLGELTQGKPILLTPVYYQCPMLCNMTMDGQVRSLTELALTAGEDFTAITFSFDPRESHQLAASAKRTALSRYGRTSSAQRGWRFLTGEESQIKQLTEAVGFRYKWDAETGQYAHAAGLVVLTPEGKVSRYLYGVHFPPRDLRLALVEASGGKIGTPTDRVLLLCFHYDPATGKYGLAIMNLLRAAGLATVLGLAAAIFVMLRRERRQQSSAITSKLLQS